MGFKNKVVAGDYEGKIISNNYKDGLDIAVGWVTIVKISKATVESYELITDGVPANNKGTYTVTVQFKDGKKSLIELDDKLYKLFIKYITEETVMKSQESNRFVFSERERHKDAADTRIMTDTLTGVQYLYFSFSNIVSLLVDENGKPLINNELKKPQ